MRLLAAAMAVVLIELLGSAAVYPQTEDLDPLRRRVGTYARRFITEFSNVVTEETYEQSVGPGARRRRVLKSEFMLVSYPGRQDLVMVFRDVREVDGKPVANKQERISELFLRPFDNAVQRAKEIHRDGLRYSASFGRLMDPLTVIGYLQPEYQGGFRFSLGSRVESLGPGVREIDLLPVARRGTTGKPARVWVSESSGEVLRTELRSGFGSRAEITTTTFDTDPALGIRVPTTLRDEVPGRNEDFVGTATYRNFRRFAVQTESVVDVPTTNP